MSPEEQIELLKKQISVLESENRLPWWKRVYADSILEKMQDFIAVLQSDSAQVLGERLEKWLARQSDSYAEKKEHTKELNFTGVWKKKILEDELERLRLRIENSKILFPGFEAALLNKEIRKASTFLSEEKLPEGRALLIRLREKVIRRVQRSLRARKKTLQNSPTWESLRKESVGIYNSRRILQDFFTHISSSDAIWTEDFIELYGNLFRLEDRFHTDKKKSKRKK